MKCFSAFVGVLCLLLSGPLAAQTTQLAPVAAGPAPPQKPYPRISDTFHTAVVNRLAQDDGGRIIATASDDKTVRVFDARNGTPLATLRVPIGEGDEGALYAVSISPDGRTLLAGGNTGLAWDGSFAVYMFDLEQSRMRGRLPNLPGPINHIAFAPDGRSFAVALGGTGGIRLFNATSGAVLATDDEYRDRATFVAFDPHGRFAVASFDGEIRLYDAAGKRLARRSPVPGGHPYSVAFSPDGRMLAVGYADQPRVELLDAADLTSRASLRGRETGGTGLGAVAWGKDGTVFAAGSLRGADGRTVVRRWVGGSGRPADWPGLHDTVFQVQATEDGGVLLVGADPALVRLDRTGRVVFRKDGPGLDFRDVTDRRFVVASDGMSVQLQTRSMREPWTFDLGQRSVSVGTASRSLVPLVAPAGHAIAVTGWHNGAHPTVGGVMVPLEKEELARSYAASRDFAFLGSDYQIRTLRPDGGRADAVALPAPVWGLALSANGARLVAAVGDGTLRWFAVRSDGRLEQLISVFLAADGMRWVAWTDAGFFDHADRGGVDLLGFQLNRGRGQTPIWLSFAQVYRLLYAPDVVAARLRGEAMAQPAVTADDLRRLQDAAPPPAIVLHAVCWQEAGNETCRTLAPSDIARGLRPVSDQAPTIDATVPAAVESVSLHYRLDGQPQARNGAVDLFVNGRNAGRTERALRSDVVQVAAIEGGPNDVQLRAYDRDGLTYAQSRTVRIQREAASQPIEKKPSLFILAVGIDRYKPGINRLAFAVADARAVAAAVRAHTPSSYGAIEVTELYDEDATADRVRTALAAIGRRANDEDTVLVYLSGHGTMLDRRYYFVTENVDSVEAVPRAALAESTLVQALATIPAHNLLLFLDTCHAGALSVDAVGNIAHESGRYVLAAAASLEEALDSYDGHNGVFATAVLRGLVGGALSRGQTVVTNFDLGLFVTPLVRQLASERHHNQSARFKIATDDARPFPIVEIREPTR